MMMIVVCLRMFASGSCTREILNGKTKIKRLEISCRRKLSLRQRWWRMLGTVDWI